MHKTTFILKTQILCEALTLTKTSVFSNKDGIHQKVFLEEKKTNILRHDDLNTDCMRRTRIRGTMKMKMRRRQDKQKI